MGVREFGSQEAGRRNLELRKSGNGPEGGEGAWLADVVAAVAGARGCGLSGADGQCVCGGEFGEVAGVSDGEGNLEAGKGGRRNLELRKSGNGSEGGEGESLADVVARSRALAAEALAVSGAEYAEHTDGIDAIAGRLRLLAWRGARTAPR